MNYHYFFSGAAINNPVLDTPKLMLSIQALGRGLVLGAAFDTTKVGDYSVNGIPAISYFNKSSQTGILFGKNDQPYVSYEAQSQHNFYVSGIANSMLSVTDLLFSLRSNGSNGVVLGATFATYGAYAVISSSAVKTNITNVTASEALNRLNSISVKYFYYSNEYRATQPSISTERQEGLIAEETAPIYPSAVIENLYEFQNGYKPGMDYTKFIPDLIRSAQHFYNETLTLRSEVNTLKSQMAQLLIRLNITL